ncbi:hypothetical protein DM01DRAFT_1378357 [Hesseltinella vesiculosa]|uniref:F-box domain-containing protein n=1 Tax=Hesseltinella vesiculosa TaxID=101127 RepID=A0A1X2G5L6_9FUNG|nr:hypothetical protein DM01DRAFT_1378357 [Hesseltinella vesiculosa]
MTSPSSIECEAHISSLPQELLESILLSSDKQQQKQLRCVNRRFHDLVTPHLFQSITLNVEANAMNIIPSSPCLALLLYLEQQQKACAGVSVARHVRSIKAGHVDLSLEDLTRFLRVCPGVTDLALFASFLTESFNGRQEQINSSSFPADRQQAVSSEDHLQVIFGGCSSIRNLQLMDPQLCQQVINVMHRMLPYLSHLNSLDLGLCVPMPEQSFDAELCNLASLQSHCPHLTSLAFPVARAEYGLIDTWQESKKKGGDFDSVIRPWTTVTDFWLVGHSDLTSGAKLGRIIAFVCVKFPRLTSLTLDLNCPFALEDTAALKQTLMDPSLGCFRHLETLKLECYGSIGVAQHVLGHFTSIEPRKLKSLTLKFHVDVGGFDFLETVSQFPALESLHTEGIGQLEADLENDVAACSLARIDISSSWPVGSSNTLDAIGRLSPSLQYLKINIGAWGTTILSGTDNETFRLKDFALGRLNLAAPCSYTSPRTISLAHFNHLSRLDIVDYGSQQTPGLLFLAEVSYDTTLMTLKSWFIEKDQSGKTCSIRCLGNSTPPELDAFANWFDPCECDDDSVTSDPPSFDGFMRVIVMHSLPEHIYYDSLKAPSK